MHRFQRHFTLVLLLLACLMVSAAVAQETTAGLQGYVKDPTAAAVTKATVEVSAATLIGTKKLETDASGFYRFSNLPPGQYTLVVTAAGFRTVKRTGIKLETGRLPNIDITLEVGTTTETVEVTGAAPLVDVSQSKVSVTIEEQTLDKMPKGRSFQSVIPFAPGARQEPLQSRRDDPTRANGFQIDGASDSENVYMVEGLNTTNIQDGGVGKNVPFEFVQEVQIKSSSFEAEYGGALGGVVNVIQKKGANNWHGSLFTHYRSDAFNANDQCGTTPAPNALSGQQINCGLRGDPNTSFSSGTRTDQAAQYYIQMKDPRKIVEPGFEIGGPILKDRLWIFSSYVPTLDSMERTVNFNGSTNPGLRTFSRSYQQHNAMTRLDYLAFSKLRVFSSWQYGYSKTKGVLPGTPDSVYNQLNTSASTDPSTIRSDTGTVAPSSVYNFGGDWTPSSKMVVTSRFGYFFNNSEDRGRPVGLRYLYSAPLNAPAGTDPGTLGLDGALLNQAYKNTIGFSNIGPNQQFIFDAYKRKTFSSDASYFVSSFLGTHTFKVGYAWNKLSNTVLNGYNTAEVDLFYGQKYPVATNQNACDAIIAQNIAQYGANGNQCRGYAGYFVVHDGVDTAGKVTSNNHALYLQDAWNVGRGLTLNIGVRFDKEFLPPYGPGASSINFGFGDKVAPRIGGAYDVLHNGKLKLYASYGKFFDIMKYSLPRGSFGGEYWHDCVYAMDDPNFNTITPTAPGNHGCPASGPAPGVTVGRFIENVDFRRNIINPLDPGVDPNIKPMQQHEYVAGADWAIRPNLGLEVRYSRKRLDQTIEDIGITDDLGFYIGNPGSTYGDLLHRTANGLDPQCPSCPAQPKAIRNYDGLELRLTKQASEKWFGSVSYTYSRLRGNYSGLTDTDITDGNGGRHSPNNHRAFDQPQLQFDSHGNIIDGPLSTDRPHALKMFGWYRLKWWGQETTLGLTQSAFSGTPITTCWPTLGTTSSCVYVEGRGNWVDLHALPGSYQPDSTKANFCDTCGNLVSDGIQHGRRTGVFSQTDMSFNHSFRVSKNHENQRLGFEWTVSNLLNQRNVLSVFNTPFAGGGIATPKDPAVPETGVDWKAFLNGWDYVGVSNGQALTLSNRYGKPNLFQASRTMRFSVRYTF
ncbi:MAG TPA: TonB-dependent receptor [Clostridia bacterium]|nr:TonB-dependent receptor [Clostridia bacterium]